MDFSELPVDIKLLIFSYFPPEELSKRLALVCREWRTLCKHPTLLKTIELKFPARRPVEFYSKVLSRYRTSLRSLTFISSGASIRCFFSNFENARPWILKDLTVNSSDFCDSDMHVVVSNCPYIEILSLYGFPKNMTFKFVQHIVTLTNLRSLAVCFEKLVAKQCLEVIAKKCTQLEALDFKVVDYFADGLVSLLAKHRKQTLKYLSLKRTNFTQEEINALASFPNISTLKICCRQRPEDIEDFKVLSGMNNLTCLSLDQLSGYRPEAWEGFFKSRSLSSLRILDLYSTLIDDRGVESLAVTCRQLVVLRLSSNSTFSDRGVHAVIHNCSKLWYLDFGGMMELTSDILRDIPDKLPNLTWLNLNYSFHIKNRDVMALLRKCPRLTVLHGGLATIGSVFHGAESTVNIKLGYTFDHRLKVKWNPPSEWFAYTN